MWDRFHRWLAVNAPQVREDLPPGATDDEIRLTEATLGLTLPEDFKASYRIHNGQGKYNLIGMFEELLPLDRIRSEWEAYRELAEEGAGSMPWLPLTPVRDVLWSVGWVPFTSDGAGQRHCVDLDPTELGQIGQVFYSDHEDLPELRSQNFRAWLANLVSECEAGQRVYSEERRAIVEADRL